MNMLELKNRIAELEAELMALKSNPFLKMQENIIIPSGTDTDSYFKADEQYFRYISITNMGAEDDSEPRGKRIYHAMIKCALHHVSSVLAFAQENGLIEVSYDDIRDRGSLVYCIMLNAIKNVIEQRSSNSELN